ncbi:unnamed protein product [Arabis nemorensis]|uniref:PGG domain-containing protein n=1 Tax=Arabis nemorensis TaxID=586526 RepID=A0A565CFN1_9BRAS|nr:unnamed protein product [Arabis nemorensis]
MQTLAHQLVEELWESVELLPEGKFTDLLNSPSRLIFDAAESGNFEFLVILIRSHPDFIWKENDKGLSLFHVAALHRHKKIFNIIYELKGIKDFIAPYKENESQNTLLHLVACLPSTDRVQFASVAALQMQSELLWFEAAKGTVPLSYIITKNKKGDIPHELFTTQHESLRKDGEIWMKETATLMYARIDTDSNCGLCSSFYSTRRQREQRR